MTLRRFDDRLVPAVSADLARNRSLPVPYPHSLTIPQSLTSSIFTWSTPERLVLVVSAPSFIQKYGNVVAIEPAFLYCAVATDMGYIICFDSSQNVQYCLGSIDPLPSVTALCLSPDSLIVCAGYLDGSIRVWDLNKLDPVNAGDWDLALASPTLQISPRQDLLAGPPASPLSGSESVLTSYNCITNILFVAGQNNLFLSLNGSGQLLYHHVAKNLFAYYHSSNHLAEDALAIATLPLGPERDFTDRLGVYAYVSSTSLVIGSCLSLNDNNAFHRRIHYTDSKIDQSQVVNLDWCPRPKSESVAAPIKLAISTGKSVSIILLSSRFLAHVESLVDNATDKDKALPPLIFHKGALWTASDPIVAIKWLNHLLLSVFTDTKIANLYVSLEGQDLSKQDLQPVSHEQMAFQISHSPAKGGQQMIKRWQNRLFALIEGPHKHVKIAARKTWKAVLESTVHPLERVRLTAWLYSTDNQGLAVLLGLPHSRESRQTLLAPVLTATMTDSVSLVITESTAISGTADTLDFYFGVAAELASPAMVSMIENILHKVNDESLFFSRLQPFVLSGRLTRVTPLVLQRIVEHYAKHNKDILIQFLCVLDISLLDIDLTMHLCEKYALVDCSIYIYNTLFRDYESPLHKLFKGLDSLQTDCVDEAEHSPPTSSDPLLIYTYLTYTLTGRQYPDGLSIASPHDIAAATSAMRFLLNNGNSNNTLLFPNLMRLIRYDSFAFFVMLNEFFECSFLNESKDRTFSRQYIVDALLDAFEFHVLDLEHRDLTLFAVFVARNYAKYPQFIRLPESQLESVAFRLCAPTTEDLREDCELALMSLLAHYSTADPRHMLAALHLAKYHRVLLAFYRSRSQYAQVLKVWIEQIQSTPMLVSTDNLDSILGQLWAKPTNATERMHLNSLVKESFAVLAGYDAETLAVLVDKHAPRLHLEALALKDIQVQQRYLSTFFNDCVNTNDESVPLLCAYLKILCSEKIDPHELVLEWAPRICRLDTHYLEARTILGAQSHSARALAQLLVAGGKCDEALDALIDRLTDLCEHSQSCAIISTHLDEAIKICKVQDETEVALAIDTIDTSTNASLGEDMWLKLTLALVTAANSPRSDHERTQYLNECIGNCFRSMTDNKLSRRSRGGDAQQASFARIFNRFLQSNMHGDGHQHVANLANISDVLQHVFLSYSSETELLQVSVKMLNREIYSRIHLLEAQNLKGWSISNRYCSKCLKALWGVAPILYRHIEAWQDRQRRKVFQETEKENDLELEHKQEDYSDCDVVQFRCSHSYHGKCLSIQKDISPHSLMCIICER